MRNTARDYDRSMPARVRERYGEGSSLEVRRGFSVLGWLCNHEKMRYCCDRPCGHLVCPCGLTWDEGAER